MPQAQLIMNRKDSRQKRVLWLTALCLLLTISSSCEKSSQKEHSWGRMKELERVVGNMNDTSYSTGRTQAPRFNALGQPVSMPEFDGHFVWSEYAAPWCAACGWQTPETKQAERGLAGSVVFLTIMTSKGQAFNDHATVETAQEWAGRYGLDSGRVLAAELWHKTIPEHRFYSPNGHTLFVHVGSLSATQIQEKIAFYKSGYDHWSKTGEAADWMTFQ